jgi:hypothetical protein
MKVSKSAEFTFYQVASKSVQMVQSYSAYAVISTQRRRANAVSEF